MLPGFRFLFVAVVLSVSIVVFGLGAAALLRSAHQEFASLPSRRPPPEAVFAQRFEDTTATLAMLRVDTPVPTVTSGPATVSEAPKSAPEPSSAPVAETDKPGAAVFSASPDQQPEAQKPEPSDKSAGAPAEPELQAEPAPRAEAAVVPAEEQKAEPANVETRVASIEEPPAPGQPAPSEPPMATPSDDGAAAATRVAMLAGPEAVIEPKTTAKPAKTASPGKSAAPAKQAQKRRVKRRRIARPRVVAPTPPTLGFFDPAPAASQRARFN